MAARTFRPLAAFYFGIVWTLNALQLPRKSIPSALRLLIKRKIP